MDIRKVEYTIPCMCGVRFTVKVAPGDMLICSCGTSYQTGVNERGEAWCDSLPCRSSEK